MTLFKYKAVDKEDKVFEATLEAPDKGVLYREIKKQGGTLISAEEADKKKKGLMHLEISFFSRVKMHDKIIFARNLGAMINAGLAMTRALSVMSRQSKNKKFKKVLEDLQTSIAQGNSFSDSLAKFPDVFSTLFVSMVKAGEESGNVAQALDLVSKQMEKTYLLTKKVRGAMMYPAVIFVVMIVIAVLMLIFIVPTLTTTFADLNVELPASTRFIIWISDFVRHNGLYALLGLIALGTGAWFAAKNPKGKRALDWSLLHLPIIGNIVKEINSARTARTLSSLLSSGVDIVIAINVTADVLQNSYYKEVMKEASEKIEKGQTMSTILSRHEKLYPVFVSEMASVGEETGKIGDMLTGVAQFYEDSVDSKTKDMSTIIEPFLMIIIGAAVGFFAISMLLPTYSLVDAI